MAKDMKAYMANRRLERRTKLVTMSGGKCEKCGSTDNLEFNHKDREEKEFILSGCHLDKSWDKIVLEWHKCELLCRECHVAYTRLQWDTKQLKTWRNMQHIPYTHGTMRTYHEMKCKCDPCRLAKKLYRSKEVGYWDTV